MKLRIKIIICLVLLLLVFLGFIYYTTMNNNKLNFENGNSKQEIGRSMEFNSKKLTIEYPKIGNKKIDNKINSILKKYEKDTKKKKNEDIYINYESYLAPDNNMSIVFIKTVEINFKIEEEQIDIYNFNLISGEKLKDSYVFIENYQKEITKYLEEYFKINEEYKTNCNIKRVAKENYRYKYSLTNNGLNIYFDRGELCDNEIGIVTVFIPYKKISPNININTKNKTTKNSIKKNLSTHLTYQNIVKNMYVKRVTNLYETDDQNSKLIDNLNIGNKVKVLKENNNWYQLKYKNKKGYVKHNSLSSKAIIYEDFKEKEKTMYALHNLDIYRFDDLNSDVVGNYKRGDKIKQLATNERGWSEILYSDGIAFVYSTYLSQDKVKIKSQEKITLDKDKQVVALTFDDGPNPKSSNRILDTLEKYKARATFFDLGTLMSIYPNVVQREEEIGCEVGSHTYRHANLNTLSSDEIKDDIKKSEEVFMSVLGHKPTVVRTPYGNANDLVRANIPYPLINWNVDTLDWQSRNKDAILNRIRSIGDYNGKIILMHSIYQSTADAVDVIVPELINQGYQLVTISELAEYKGVTLKAGQIYNSIS